MIIIIDMRAINWLFKRVVKVRLEGPIDLQIQQKILEQLGKITTRNSQALILIINSYGGSLRAAKNISDALKQIQSKSIPVYCFAQEYCLNSANVILTSSTKCFANKLSIIGDFGYVYDQYSFEQFTQKYNVGVQKLSYKDPKIDIVGNNYQINNKEFMEKLLASNAGELRNYILLNRRERIKNKSISPSILEEQMLKGGSILPSQAEKMGFIDGLQTYTSFLKNNLRQFRIKQQKEYKQYRAINFLRNTLQIFKTQ